MAGSHPSHLPHAASPASSVAEARTALLKRATRAAIDYLDDEETRPVAPTPQAVAALSEIGRASCRERVFFDV
jgi:hypothetical protein